LLLGDAVLEFYEIGLIETTQSDPAFQAALDIQAGYVSSQITPLLGVTVDVGVRYEDAKQTVDPVEVFITPIDSGTSTSLNNDYFLPAVTLTYEISDGLQLRANASKTIARPQFRELIFQTYYDPETNRQYNGNPLLQDSELINAEMRAEYYFGRGNRASIAGFYKNIDKPIEAFSSFSDNDQLTSFANAPSAQLYGAEFELQYNYDLVDLGSWFESKRAVVVTNYTFTQSSIQVSPDDVTQIFPRGPQAASNFFFDGAPLTGQSDHIVNVQLGLEDIDKLQQFTFLMSYASERVTSRGAGGLPDIVEDPGFRLDFVARQGLDLGGVPLEVKLEARNIFGRDNFEFQTNGTNRIEINTYEVGQSFSLSVSAEF
jgi:outer membrane receptor protein involved in Fe transport